ncbi:diguanylate cyclase [Candidatus Marinarcus aquaticus]|uniref:diguanylate cyclase n=1 Tax=Candidatus Marinarcus aquaticus TaxID=2044504 RepID=A0A4V1LP80_9BACT|nr:diguanylate cyclase [Candidatus Marinarcus aquaticus]RXJ60268.1 hypothetical protein CRV04_04510 [Candidatus Marinarcus aquaticus]
MINKKILTNIKVLYVEDEDDVRNFTAKTLSAVVKEVVLASNGQEGVDKFKLHPDIDLIITDINMPKLGGLEMCEEIQHINKDIPIVITSAHNDPDFLKKAIDIGVDAYAMKPVDLYQLLECMVKAIEPIYLRKQLEEINSSLENKVEEGIKQVKLILDSQDNIVVVTDGAKISQVNKKFLDFFKIDSLDDFLKKNQCIFSCFKQEDNFFSCPNVILDETWIDALKKLPEINRVVKIDNCHGEERIFAIKIHEYEAESMHYVISFTDITEIKEKSNLLEYQANHDQLTGLYNRQKFQSIFSKEINRTLRYKDELSLIMLDIDFFKIINDTYGHETGDRVLCDVSKVIQNSIRQSDSAVRWGGEEFIILLPETNLENAMAVAYKIKENLELFSFEYINNREVTASFGVTQLNATDTDNTFINRADQALYEAKRQGRNRIIKA